MSGAARLFLKPVGRRGPVEFEVRLAGPDGPVLCTRTIAPLKDALPGLIDRDFSEGRVEIYEGDRLVLSGQIHYLLEALDERSDEDELCQT
jgi:hypothetical protein